MTGVNLGLDPSIGSFFIGILFSITFYGITNAQVLFYYWEYRQDRWYLKAMVAWLWVMDTANSIVEVMVIWEYLVTDHGNPLGLFVLSNSFLAEYAIAAITVLFVQCYYMRNVWKLLQKRWYQVPLTITMLIFALISCACSLASVYLGTFDRAVPEIFVQTKIPASLQTVSASVTDIYITLSLTLILRGERTGFKHTETLVHKLTVYAINRGIVTTLLQIFQLCTYVSLPDTYFVWAIFHFPGSKAYVNSLLAMVNARHYLRENSARANLSTGVSVQDIPLDTLDPEQRQKSSWFRNRSTRQDSQSAQAVITLTTEVVCDGSEVALQDQHKGTGRKTPSFF
ncbi:uncharacterized protein LAESUDRAFT_754766 [Laetiporus sulphureus 93-53]|uniref:DUF6534 domain-containing protein n=1 Tax=Laetiporus sulphureus 93-53 TaxID=1314785 RepID=A0A165HWQ9_9APHY|nr:uncharacterized protein LAESUDRAFT_754766 [Laetiporus sulphureus 93-53]KZT12289.1 hypothetical protein LAESUDRAFT_754766 [Laetiporus sulphureus 93-53]